MDSAPALRSGGRIACLACDQGTHSAQRCARGACKSSCRWRAQRCHSSRTRLADMLSITGCFGAAQRPRTPPQPSGERAAMVTVSSSESLASPSPDCVSPTSAVAAAVSDMVVTVACKPQRRGILSLTPQERAALHAEMNAVAGWPLFEPTISGWTPAQQPRVPRLDMRVVYLARAASARPRAAPVAPNCAASAAATHLAMVPPHAAAMSRDALIKL